jgi:hypothetical protein
MIAIKNQAVWRQTRVIFLASALLFLANIYFGFDNALTAGLIPRWQILVHLHAGTLGWITLSMFALAIWMHTGDRDVSPTYVRRIIRLSWLAIGVFAGYVLSFGLAFAYGRPFTYLMPVFGISASLLIWTFAIYSVVQLKRQPVATTTQLLITTALLVAAFGSSMGVLLGLEYIVGSFIPGADRIGVHAAAMDAYILLSGATIIEAFLQKDLTKRWSWSGMALALVWGLSGLVLIPALLFSILPLAMISVPLLLLGLVIFLARGGWRGIATSPFKGGSRRWLFFGSIWTTFWPLFFVWVLITYINDIASIPPWVAVAFAHLSFIGLMTNLLLGVGSTRSQEASQSLAWAETAAMWTINIGLVLFLVLEYTAGIRLGAIVMGIGVLLGVATMIVRLLRVRESEEKPVAMAEVVQEAPAD